MAGPSLDAWREVCTVCGRTWPLVELRWECSCGGLLDLVGPLADPFGRPSPSSPVERYAAALPPGAGSVDLGMVTTTLAEVRPGVYVKADYEQPTGSFKDRGAAVMIGTAASRGVHSVVLDSSGNAGKAAAAHAARAGLACTVYVPAGTAAEKVAAMARYGATVVEVPGGREAAAVAARAEVGGHSRWYASHVHQPLFHHGIKTLAFELYEQLPDLASPGATVVVPVGNGTLVLGLWLGFGELVALGRLRRRPALAAVQAERCAPLAGRRPASEPTAAAGIAIQSPPRAAQIRAAVLASGGRLLVAGEEPILAAQAELAELGFDVEPTGAVAWAGVGLFGPLGPLGGVPAGPGPVVAVLTGR